MADAKNTELFFGNGGATPTISNFALNQTTDQLEVIFQVPAGMSSYTVTRLGIRQGTTTGTPPTYRLSLQGVDSSGNPDGTIKNSGNAFVDFAPVSGGNNTWQWKNLGATYAASPGEVLALVIAYQSGTVDASNFCTFSSNSSLTPAPGLPYAIQNDAGSRTRQGPTPIFGWGTATQAYGLPVLTTIASALGSNNERALLLTIPSTWCASYKIVGLRVYCIIAAGNTATFILYDTDGTTVLQDYVLDTDQDRAGASAIWRTVYFDEGTLATLTAGSTYRLAVKQSGGSNVTVHGFTVNASADLEAWEGGSIATLSSRSGGAWTDDNTSRPFIHPILADITAPSGGGTLAFAMTGRG